NDGDLCPDESGANYGCIYNETVPSNENYIHSRIYQVPLEDPYGVISNRDLMESMVYYDGLGRPMQEIAIKASPNLDDIVTHIGYDGFGRVEKEWLPYAASGTTGSYRTTAEADTDTYYVAHHGSELGSTPNPFSQKELELS